jgi:hypothetical protein
MHGLNYPGRNIHACKEHIMAKQKSGKSRKYGELASRKVKKAVHEMKEGKLKSGRSGKRVKSRKQAVAIGLSEARRAGGKVPKKSGGRKKSSGKSG